MLLHVMNERAMFEDLYRYLIVSDLHLGMERMLEDRGFKVPNQFDFMLSELLRLVKLTDASGIIILGDVKHEIGSPAYPENFRRFFKILEDQAHVIVVKGNHDGNIEDFADVEIHSSRGFRKWNYYFTHGHTWPLDSLNGSEYLLMGHIHPEIRIMNEKTKKIFNSCWLKARPGKNFKKRYPDFAGEIIIFPAFNPLAGMALSEHNPGPLFRNRLLNMRSMDVYLLDSTYLGKFGNIKK